MKIIEQLEDADKTLAADGYKEDSYVRLAISEAIRALRQPPVSGELPYLDELRAKVEYLESVIYSMENGRTP